ncbi:sensor histidine kinase [Halarcobacter ebronensis]|uniref:histidine kinase n=1 Tax=Halarcobacter ebronensis TaxID=1462615 RepID=A0A4Q1APD4_9BACT|nr:HAMP domain-containing sensor histidine kinase [Halarcobacter ebronensis]QKF81682.1 two-component system sensor histidine kinase [Halarcobacter ebronensis]RXK04638.1 two-component sensor histidine kinase [Halarcobacter ebronensis]
MKLQSSEKKLAYFYTLLLMILFSIPVYFALNLAVNNELIIKEMALKNFSNEVEKSLYSGQLGLVRSVKVNFAFVNKDGEIQLNNLSKDLDNFNFRVYEEYPYLYYRKDVNKNIYDVSFIVSEVELNYSKAILLAILLFIVVLMNIYILNKSIIRSATRPYEILQKYTNVLFNDTMHELKTPLGILNINLDLLSRNSEPNKYVKRMKTAIKQIQVNYESIEYYIKNRKIKYSKEKINLSTYLESRIEYFEDIANSKFIKIRSEIENKIYVYMNSLELQRVIDNTLMNAIKYSRPESNVEINLALDENKNYALLSIKDYGYGIKDTDAIFDRFSREDTIQGGFGLGLNIVKTICNKDGIKISVESKENFGSTFSYRFEIYKIKFLDRIEDAK